MQFPYHALNTSHNNVLDNFGTAAYNNNNGNTELVEQLGGNG